MTSCWKFDGRGGVQGAREAGERDVFPAEEDRVERREGVDCFVKGDRLKLEEGETAATQRRGVEDGEEKEGREKEASFSEQGEDRGEEDENMGGAGRGEGGDRGERWNS